MYMVSLLESFPTHFLPKLLKQHHLLPVLSQLAVLDWKIYTSKLCANDTCVCMYVCMYVCIMYVRMYVCMCMCMYIHTHMPYTPIHT